MNGEATHVLPANYLLRAVPVENGEQLVTLKYQPRSFYYGVLVSRFESEIPGVSAGYDGQFVYYIARDPNPGKEAPHLDVPAYRYQRILYPLLARLLAFGKLELIPLALILLGIMAHTVGTWAVSRLLGSWRVNPWVARIYGLWVVFLLALIVDLPEPLAFALVV